ncbi:hypothetical protein RHMOL_Rhmol09G0093500 [Rhododendron molle]|uniref:Uncharacterized protein n=1 Tax=Rhododendron molle TaxID=49168 RepID=A0ACC0MC49_RHOML|nr:hypothetical protein RHMOL_Rhmol09G0093500 [Rhododendron molle]
MAEQGNEEGEKDNAKKVQGLDDLNTPSNPSFEVDSARYKSTMEEIEILKRDLEEKDVYISKLCKKNEVLEKLYKQYEEQVQHYETHELTQGYNVETERQVHQVTQKATFDTIKELREERDQLEGELINIKVHEVTQKVRAEKVLGKSEKKSPPSKFKRVKERDDRKMNFCEDYVYGKLKRKSPQLEFVDVDDFQETSLAIQVRKQKKKLKNLKKCNTGMSKLIRTETWLAIEQLWKTGNLSAIIWSSEADMLHIEVKDIQNLLFEDAISNQTKDVGSSTTLLNLEVEKMNIVVQHYSCVDCAIVVFSIIKKYLSNEEQTSEITKEECRKIRADLIHLFVPC